LAKKKANAPVKKVAKAPAKALAAKKQMSLYYPQPNEVAGRVRVTPPKIPAHSAPLDISPSPALSKMEEPKKKPGHDAAIAILGAALISGAMAAFFHYLISLDIVLSLMLALPFFIGLSILFFNFLELSARTGTQ